jgi:hypothetical protein
MVRFLKIAVYALAAIVLLGFAFANHHLVTVSFDPFASIDSAALSPAHSRPGCRKGAIGEPRAKAGSKQTNGERRPRR